LEHLLRAIMDISAVKLAGTGNYSVETISLNDLLRVDNSPKNID